MKRKVLVILLFGVAFLAIVGFGGLTYLDRMKIIGNYKVVVNGKVVDEKNVPLDDVTLKITYYTPGFTPPDFECKETVEYKTIKKEFQLKWRGHGMRILVGKKGYTCAEYFAVDEFYNSDKTNEIDEINKGISAGKIARPPDEEYFKLYEKREYEHNVVFKLRKLKNNLAVILKNDWIAYGNRYRLFLNKPGKLGVKFRDDPKKNDPYDIYLVMREEDGKMNAWLETSENGGIIILPEQNIHEMFEAPETGYKKKVYLNDLVGSFYLITAEGKYVKGNIRGGVTPARDSFQPSADINFDPCAIQPDGSRYLETVNTELLDEIFEPEDEDGDENDEEEDIDDKPERETKEEFAKTALIIGVYPDGRVKIKNEIVPLDELDSLLKKHGATAESKVMIEEAEYGYSVKTDVLEKVVEKIRKYGIMKIRFR